MALKIAHGTGDLAFVNLAVNRKRILDVLGDENRLEEAQLDLIGDGI